MQATIKDVAKAAGLSITTVSLVLNDKPNGIPQKTRERIFTAAKELNYAPNQVARAMVTKEMSALGLLIPDVSNAFFAELAKNVEQEARRSNYSTLLCDLNSKQENQESYLRILAQNNVKSVIFADAPSEQLYKVIESLGMTVVFADQFIGNGKYDCVSVDNRKGARLAMEHIISLGHRKIGCILGPEGHGDAQERLEGVWEACAESGAALDPDLTYVGDYTFESGIAGGEKLIRNGATAIFAFNDMMAYGVWDAAKTAGKKIPDDLSVVGFDDLLYSKFLPAPLTTVYQPVADIGRLAVQILMSAISGEKRESREILLEPELIKRASTARIGKRGR